MMLRRMGVAMLSIAATIVIISSGGNAKEKTVFGRAIIATDAKTIAEQDKAKGEHYAFYVNFNKQQAFPQGCSKLKVAAPWCTVGSSLHWRLAGILAGSFMNAIPAPNQVILPAGGYTAAPTEASAKTITTSTSLRI